MKLPRKLKKKLKLKTANDKIDRDLALYYSNRFTEALVDPDKIEIIK